MQQSVLVNPITMYDNIIYCSLDQFEQFDLKKVPNSI